MTESKHRRQVADIAKRYPPDMLTCRDTGHTWQPDGAAWLQDRTIERVLTCPRCQTRRVTVLSSRGYILTNRYEYPTGYNFVGMGRLDSDDRAILRRTAVLRIIG